MNKSINVNLAGDNGKGGGALAVSFTNLTQKEYAEIKEKLSKDFGIDF